MATSTPAPPPASAPPPATPPSAAPAPTPQPLSKARTSKFSFAKAEKKGKRIGIYGPGGIGKSTLASMAPGPVAAIDLDDSIGELNLPNIQVIQGIETWADLREALQAPIWNDFKTIQIDSVTRADELCIAHVIANVPHEKGNRVTSIEGYGFGKGYTHVFEEFLRLLGDIDVHVRAGRNIVMVAHDCTTTVPNPIGEDYMRYEPRLQSPASGKNSIRYRWKEWLDHLIFIGYDIASSKGKATGQGTRTIYPFEMAHCMAKTRCDALNQPFVYPKGDNSLWDVLFGQKGSK